MAGYLQTIMKHCPVILSIAGSDCSGGAGIQADIKTISALGGYAASAITAITVQNTLGVEAVHTLPAHWVDRQIRAVLSDLKPDAVKIGMVADAAIVEVIANCLEDFHPAHVVYDPVMISTSGRKLMSDDAMEAIRERLFGLTTLVTPNLEEMAFLAGHPIRTVEEMTETGRKAAADWNTVLLIKGGHLTGENMTDVLCMPDGTCRYFQATKISSRNLHGTGCTLSSAIATLLAQKHPVQEAVGLAKQYTRQAIAYASELSIGEGNGPLCHFFDPKPLEMR